MEVARGEDPETQSLRELVMAWRDCIGADTPLTAGEIVAKAEEREWRQDGQYNAVAKEEYRHPALRERSSP